MSSWNFEILRSLAQLCYWLFYRYCVPRGGTALTYVNDVLAHGPAYESQSDGECYEGPTWHERFYSGFHNALGLYVFTVPGAERLAAIMAYLEETGLICLAAFHEHSGDIRKAIRYAASMAYNRYADANFFAGRFRGQFLGSLFSDREIVHSVLLVHLLRDETIFRVRDVRVKYTRDTDESLEEFQARSRTMTFDAYEVEDFFAATGTEYGSMFLRGGPDLHIGNYEWDKKQNRILALTADQGGENEVRYVLCRKTEDINFSMDILQSVSNFLRKPVAAE